MSNSGAAPRHVAIIMDGNGRWARRKGQPRGSGHRAGGKTAQTIIKTAWSSGVGHLTLFAFSTENWGRPDQEVGLLMDLFRRSLKRDLHELMDNDVRIRFIGEHDRFDAALRAQMDEAQRTTADNAGLRLNVAIGYGGRRDLLAAAQALARRVAAGEICAADIDEASFGAELSLAGQPEPDLLIRTGGEFRISNFLLWQLAYAELYFCEVLWPDFKADHFQQALDWFAGRDRRYGRVENERSSAHA